jgi:hypothetical protein
MDYQKKYLEYKIKYMALKKQIKEQTGGYLIDGKNYSFPLFKVGERIENTYNNVKGNVSQLKQVESLIEPNTYENYYDVQYDNGMVETVRENMISKASTVSPIIAPKTREPSYSPSGPYGPFNPSGPFGPSGPSVGPFNPFGPVNSPTTYGPAPYGPGGPYGPASVYGPTISYQSPYYEPGLYVPKVYYERDSRKSSRKSSKRSSRRSSRRLSRKSSRKSSKRRSRK